MLTVARIFGQVIAVPRVPLCRYTGTLRASHFGLYFGSRLPLNHSIVKGTSFKVTETDSIQSNVFMSLCPSCLGFPGQTCIADVVFAR